MARTGVRYYDVAQAADALQEIGLEPTIDRVRERLGTGSKSTLAPLLKRWKEQRETSGTGQGLPASLLQAVKGLHDQVQQSAVLQIETARQEFAATEAALRQQVTDSQRALSDLQQRYQALETDHTTVKEARQQLTEVLSRERTNAATQGVELTELRARLTDAQAAAADLKQELRRARDSAEHYQQAVAEERRLEREHVQQLKSEWQAARDDLNRRLTAEITARHAAESEARQLRTRNQQLERLNVERQVEVDHLQPELQRHRQLLEELQPQLQSLQEERLRDAADLAELRALRDQQEAFKAQQEQQMQALEAKLTKAEDRITQLLDESRFLLQEKADLQLQAQLLQTDASKRGNRTREG